MGIFDGLFKRKNYESNVNFSSPFQKIGKGTMSTPYVNSEWRVNQNAVVFGSDNLYPQKLNQMYFSSPIHSACVDFVVNAVIGSGVKIGSENDTMGQKIKNKYFERKIKAQKNLKKLFHSYYLHNRCYLLFTTNQKDEVVHVEIIDPDKIRLTIKGDFIYCNDWQNPSSTKKIPSIFERNGAGEWLYEYSELLAGQDIYPIPSYTGGLNWVFLDSEISQFHKANIQNSIFPNLAIRRPKRLSKEEAKKFVNDIQQNIGADGAGKLFLLTGDGMENTPEIITLNTNQNDKLFVETGKESKDQICFSHRVNPALIGIRVGGTLGNTEELKVSEKIFKKTVVLPYVSTLYEIISDIKTIMNFVGDVEILENNLIEIENK